MSTYRAVAVACCVAAIAALAESQDDKKPDVPRKEEKFTQLRVVQTLKTDDEFALALAFSPDGTVLAVSDGEAARFWELRTGKEATTAWKIADGPEKLAFLDTTTIVFATSGGVISARKYPSGKELAALKLREGQGLTKLAVAGGQVVGAGPDFICLWSQSDWQMKWNLELPGEGVGHAIAFSPGGQEVAVGTGAARVRVFATKDGKELHKAGAEKAILPAPCCVTYSPEGEAIVIGPTRRDPNSRRTDDTWGLTVFDRSLSEARANLRWSQPAEEPLGCAFTPDGKTLVVPCRGRAVRIYEVATGELRCLGALPFDPLRFALSPDGRLLAVAAGGRGVTVMDWRANKPGKSAAPDDTAPARLWGDLASPDSAKAYGAVVELCANPGPAVKLLGEKVKPVALPNAADVKRRVEELGADEFAVREAAEKELAKFGDAIAPELRAALKSDSPDRRKAAERLLKAGDRRDAPERLRALRAVEVLEYLGTPQSRDVLKVLAGGAPAALQTRDAAAALTRRTTESKQ